jgi:hypothetical protein
MKKSRKKVSRKKVARKKKVLVIRAGTRSTSELQAELFKELKARWKDVDAKRQGPGTTVMAWGCVLRHHLGAAFGTTGGPAWAIR